MKKNIKILLFWLFVLIWMSFIFYLSNQPDLKSSLPGNMDLFLRKAAHITEYAVLTFLIWRASVESIKPEERPSKKYLIIVIAFLVSFIYAISDEYHQTFVLGRVGAPMDVAIDSVGIIISAILIYKGKFNKFIVFK